MASSELYPPTLDAYQPAFTSKDCILYFSLSKFSTSTETPKAVHVSVVYQKNGQNALTTEISNNKGNEITGSGLLLINGITPVDGEENLYYVKISGERLKKGYWENGCIYKIQIRLSLEANPTSDISAAGQATYLKNYANKFSEWSTYCTVKKIGEPTITIPMFNYNSKAKTNSNTEKTVTVKSSTLDFSGTYENEDTSETLYSYSLDLYDDGSNLIESSGTIYTNQYYSPNKISYLFLHELSEDTNYNLVLKYTTINKYEGGPLNISFVTSFVYLDQVIIDIYTAETIENLGDEYSELIENVQNTTTVDKEQDEGRIGLKLFSTSEEKKNYNICIRRADSKDNYSTWTDIKIVQCIDTAINNLPIVYDNTIESGVWYKYGIQIIATNGDRSLLNSMSAPVLREFNHSYLIGEGGRQLNLKFNNEMNSYSYTLLESKTDTIGGQYPYITRNGNTKYRTFPINGLISFNIDENNLFLTEEELYTYTDVINQYKARRTSEQLGYYDYKREFDFREKVLDFLQDGKPKLFKSATEGNIIVRIMSVAAQPNQTLNRMLYSFTSTAYEIADNLMSNYLNYGFYDVGDYATSFSTYDTKMGQLNYEFSIGDNIIEKIWDKFDRSDENTGGYRVSLKSIYGLSIDYQTDPLLVTNSANETVVGNNIIYNGNTITIRDGYSRRYVFDNNIAFTKDSSVIIEGSSTTTGLDPDTKVQLLVTFFYQISTEEYVEKEIVERTSTKNVGQIIGNYSANSNLYKEIYNKYYYEWSTTFRRLDHVTFVAIEANPGAVFKILDEADSSSSTDVYHDIGMTGYLNLEDLGSINGLVYIGMREPDGSINTDINCDVLIDYIYYTLSGRYAEAT